MYISHISLLPNQKKIYNPFLDLDPSGDEKKKKKNVGVKSGQTQTLGLKM